MSSRVILGRQLSNIVQFPDLGGFKIEYAVKIV